MILEWLRYITTPCPDWVRGMGYLKELIGIQSRVRRVQRHWAPHQDNTRAFILDTAKSCKTRKKALVMGAGLWFDVPVFDLCQMFDQVILADVFHLGSMRKKAKAFQNLTLIDVDLTGITEGVYRNPTAPLPTLSPSVFLTEGVDFVASVNLLSQLPVSVRHYLERKSDYCDDELDDFCKNIVDSHIRHLRAFSAPIALISDVERQIFDVEGNCSNLDSLCGGTFPEHDQEWIWNIAPRPEQDPHHDIKLKVRAARL